MTLTIPRAGIRPGRAAQTQATEPDGASAAVAAVGDAMLQMGTRLEADRLSRENARNQVSLTKDLNDLRLRMEQLGDPDQIDTEWAAGVQSVRDKYLGAEGDDGSALVSRQNRQTFGLAIDDLANRHGFQIGLKSLGKRNSQRAATYFEYASVATQAAQGADKATREGLLINGAAQIDDMVKASIISPEEGARRKAALAQDLDNAAAISMAAEDPAGLIAALDNGDLPGLPGEAQARYRVQANAAIAAQEKAAAAETDRLAKERNKAIGDRLGEIIDIAGKGRVAVDEAWLASAEVKAHPDYAKAQAAIDLRNETPLLAQLAPAELDQLIAAERGQKVTKKFQTERLEVLQAIRERAVDGLSTDPVAYAANVGLPVPSLPEFDPGDPVAFGRALGARVAFGEQMRVEGYTTERRILTNEERQAIKAAAAIDQDPGARLALAEQLTRALPPQNADAIAELIGDPVFSHVGSLVTNGGARALGLDILRGQQVIENNSLVLPGQQKRLDPLYEGLGAIFADLPGGDQMQSNVMAATDALYAARARGVAASDALDEDQYMQALHEVMGGEGQHNSRTATGGVQEVRDTLTILPMGVSAREAEGALEFLGKRKRTAKPNNPYAGIGHDFDPEMLSAQLTAVSANGKPPVVGGMPLDAQTAENLTLQAVGNDRFIFTYRVSDDTQRTLATEDGETYEFSLRALIREVRQ
ncbi:MAG: hypothetical protein AAF891_00080 [Pseudomonadota bacterium]